MFSCKNGVTFFGAHYLQESSGRLSLKKEQFVLRFIYYEKCSLRDNKIILEGHDKNWPRRAEISAIKPILLKLLYSQTKKIGIGFRSLYQKGLLKSYIALKKYFRLEWKREFL